MGTGELVWRYQVLLPPGQEPVIRLNEEVRGQVLAEVGRDLGVGDEVYLEDLMAEAVQAVNKKLNAPTLTGGFHNPWPDPSTSCSRSSGRTSRRRASAGGTRATRRSART